MFKPVDPRQNFPELEEGITKYWKANKIFQKSVSQRSPDNKYVFYDGPPFITGTPHYGSLLPSIAKDVVPRYQTMLGKRVERVWGWDCHGLPIETKVEKDLNIKNRRDVEKFGIQEFIDQCYKYTRSTSAEWKWYVDKIGRWVDFENSYKTMDQNYMESVMWMFKQMHEQGHVYEGTRTSLFCTRCGTPISNFEIAMDNSYEIMEDPGVTIKFKVTSEGKFKDLFIIAWTTTPWTLPANKALVVDPEATYVVVTNVSGADTKNVYPNPSDKLIFAKARLESVMRNLTYTVESELKGSELVGLSYEPIFNFLKPGPNDHKVYSFEGMVNMEEGVGVVHSAPGFGDIDTEMGEANKLTMGLDVVNDEGKYFDHITDYAGLYIKDADRKIVADLISNGKLLRFERIKHRYPYCYRCHTPLIHKAQPSWFINIQNLKPELLKNNDQINWVPDHLKEGRFKKGIETAPDWGISRSRFWATPLPVWQLQDNGKVVERVVIGSRDELREKAVQPITKVIFVRHAKRDGTSEDAELSNEGWEQASLLRDKLKEEKFDLVVSSTAKRAVQTVQETAQLLNQELKLDDAFGSLEDRRIWDEIEKKLTSKEGVNYVSEASEQEIQEAYADYIQNVKTKIEAFLAANKGKYILVSTHAERIALIRHIFEGTRLKEALAMDVDYAGQVIMYFNGSELLDLHRPKIDNITLKGEKGELKRVPDVLDVWMDSASMPYASKHYPFENKLAFEQNYPADYVVEYIAQTRAWFYVMHVLSSALMHQPSFRNVVTTGVIFGTDGRKMSKSYGNYPDPKDTLNKYGAEPLRLYLMGSKVMLGEDMNFDEEGLKDHIKTFILPLWNSYSFLVTYANMHGWEPTPNLVSNRSVANELWDRIPFEKLDNKMDIWIIARLQQAIRNIRTYMDEYNMPAVVREFPAFLDDLSRWYIRRSRDRFAKGDSQAIATLYYVLVEFVKLIAPVVPFISEAIYQNLVFNKMQDLDESVHLTDYPEADIKFSEANQTTLWQMDTLRDIVNLAQSLRVQHGVKVRQPLAEMEIKLELDPKRDHDFEKWMLNILQEELNIKSVQQVSDIIPKDGWVSIKDESKQTELLVNLNLTAELKREGILRDLVRAIQDLRKRSGFKITDTIKVILVSSDPELKTTLEIHSKEIQDLVSAQEISLSEKADPDWKMTKINKNEVAIKLIKI